MSLRLGNSGGLTRALSLMRQMMSEPRPPDSTRIVIADDHDKVRHAIRQFVETFRGLHVVGEASNGASAVELTRQLRPHIVLMDFHMPVMNGSEATKVICKELPEVKVIALSVHPHTGLLMRRAGACAHVDKSDLMTQFSPALRVALGKDVDL